MVDLFGLVVSVQRLEAKANEMRNSRNDVSHSKPSTRKVSWRWEGIRPIRAGAIARYSNSAVPLGFGQATWTIISFYFKISIFFKFQRLINTCLFLHTWFWFRKASLSSSRCSKVEVTHHVGEISCKVLPVDPGTSFLWIGYPENYCLMFESKRWKDSYRKMWKRKQTEWRWVTKRHLSVFPASKALELKAARHGNRWDKLGCTGRRTPCFQRSIRGNVDRTWYTTERCKTATLTMNLEDLQLPEKDQLIIFRLLW